MGKGNKQTNNSRERIQRLLEESDEEMKGEVRGLGRDILSIFWWIVEEIDILYFGGYQISIPP